MVLLGAFVNAFVNQNGQVAARMLALNPIEC
jgi:hypothetical protein